MTIKELANIFVELLGQHGDMPVVVTWEGQTIELDTSNIYVSKNNEVVIDADGNEYKDYYTINPIDIV